MAEMIWNAAVSVYNFVFNAAYAIAEHMESVSGFLWPTTYILSFCLLIYFYSRFLHPTSII